jgi:hypothetical protein
MNRAQLATTRRETVHGGSTPTADHHVRWKCRFCRSKKPALRVMVVANCARFISLAVNEAAVYVAKLLKGYAKHS